MQERWHTRLNALGWLEKIATLEDVRLTRLLTCLQHQLRRSFRMLLPQCLNAFVGLLPFGDGCAPVTKNGPFLGWRSLRGRDSEEIADVLRQWISLGIGVISEGKAEAAQVVVLVIVAVPTAVVLYQMERQHGTFGETDRFVKHKDGFARHIAAAGADVNAPGCLVFAIDGVLNWAGDTPPAAFVIEDFCQRLLRWVHVRRCPYDFHHSLVPMLRVGTKSRGSADLEFGQGACAINRSAWPAQRQVGIVEQFQADGGDRLQIGLGREGGGVLGRCVALGEDGAIVEKVVLLPAAGI